MTFPNAAPVLIQVPALAETNLIGIARLTNSSGALLATLAPTGQLDTQEPVVGGRAIVTSVPAGIWKIQVEAPDGRRWNTVAAIDGNQQALVQMQ